VQLLVTSLLRENDLEELAEALDCLALSGARRVLIDFRPVEKMSSQVVAHLASLKRQCAEMADGRVAVCGVRPALVELFEITGLSKTIPMYADERAAFETPWPDPIGPTPLPVAVLAALRSRRLKGSESEATESADSAEEHVFEQETAVG